MSVVLTVASGSDEAGGGAWGWELIDETAIMADAEAAAPRSLLHSPGCRYPLTPEAASRAAQGMLPSPCALP